MFILDSCQGLNIAFLLRIIKYIIKIIKFAVPIVLLLLCVIDFTKAVTAEDEKKMADAKRNSLRRVIYAVIVFLVPTFISLIFKLVPEPTAGSDFVGFKTAIKCYESIK